MIKSWRHKGLRSFYERVDKSGIQPAHAFRLTIILQRLDAAIRPEDMHTPGMRFHPLKEDKKGYFAVSVTGNWRVIFQFEGEHATLVDYLDYH